MPTTLANSPQHWGSHKGLNPIPLFFSESLCYFPSHKLTTLPHHTAEWVKERALSVYTSATLFLRQAWCGTWSASPRPRSIFGEGDASDTKVVIFKDSKKCSGGAKHSLIYYLCKEIDCFTHIPEILIWSTQVKLPLVRKHARSDRGALFFSRLLCLLLLFLFLPTLCPSSPEFSEVISYITRQYSLLSLNHWVPWSKWGVGSAQILGIYPTFFSFSSFYFFCAFDFAGNF